MSYADIAGRHANAEFDPGTLPEEVRLVFPQLPERVRKLIAAGRIRFEIREDGGEKTIYLIHDDPLSPECVAERLAAYAKELPLPRSEAMYAKRLARFREDTKDALMETVVPPSEPFRHGKPRTGRNERCPCGSGKKYKSCHMRA